MRFASTLLAIVLATSTTFVVSKPLTPPNLEKKKQQKPPACPDVAMESNWGTVTQNGKDVMISGHPQWSAQCHFRDDGKVFVLWTFNSDGREAPGLYEVKMHEGKAFLEGRWGYEGDVEFDLEGGIVGTHYYDSIRPLSP